MKKIFFTFIAVCVALAAHAIDEEPGSEDPTGGSTVSESPTGKVIYTTTFSDWSSQSVPSGEQTVISDTMTFTLSGVKVVPSEMPSQITSGEMSIGYIQPYSSATMSQAYIQTSFLSYVSYISYTHASTLSQSGWGVASSQNGVDWKTLSETQCQQNSASTKGLPLAPENRSHIMLRWYPLTSDGTSTNTYLTDITIYGEELPTVALAGTMNGWDYTTQTFTPSDDNQTASLTIALAANTYEFKIVEDGSWLGKTGGDGEYYTLHRDWPTAYELENSDGAGNILLTADAAGEYTFIWTYSTKNLQVVFPGQTPSTDQSYYLIGNTEQLGAWSLENALPMESGAITLNLPAGTYSFKVLPQNDGWDGALGYSNFNSGCSSENITTDVDGNVVVTFSEAGELNVSVADGLLCVTGTFSYTSEFVNFTVDVTPEGSGYVYPTSGSYQRGSNLSLEASISTGGWMFDQWSDNGAWDNPRSLYLTQDTTVTAIFSPGEYGILINGNRLVRGTFTERLNGSYIAQFRASASLSAGDQIKIINLFHGDNSSWRPELEEGGSSESFSIGDAELICNQAGCYDIYMKIAYGQSSDYVYIGGGTDCSTGEPFGTGDIYVYSVVGTANLFGTAWDKADTKTEMTLQGESMYAYTIDSIALYPDSVYEYKVISNHEWNVQEWPNFEENYNLSVEEPGVYQVLFMLNPGTGCTATTNYLHAIQDEQPCGIIASGECGADGNNLMWILYCDSVLTISGSGEMEQYSSYSSVPWYTDYRTKISAIEIGEGVTSIGNYAFRSCTKLNSVFLPSTVQSIGNYAFYGCSSLPSVNLPSELTSIGTYAFRNCSTLTNVSIPGSVETIGTYAFYGCPKLTSVTCEASTPPTISSTTIFSTYDTLNVPCSSLELYKQATIWKNFSTILCIPCIVTSGKCGAEGDSTNVLWSLSCDSVLTISGSGAMAEYISGDTFNPGSEGNPSNSGWGAPTRSDARKAKTASIVNTPWEESLQAIKVIRVEEGVTHVGESSFEGCSNLVEVNLPGSLQSIGNYAFYGCSLLANIDCNNPTPAEISEYTFDSSTQSTCILNVPYGSGSQYQYANYWSAFSNINEKKCILASGTCGSDLTWELGCDSVLIINGTGSISSSSSYLSYKQAIKHVTLNEGLTSIPGSAFNNCSNLISIDIPNTVKSIGLSAFEDCSSLVSITIPSGVTNIEMWAFRSCTALTSVAISTGLTSLNANRVFDNCPSIVSMTVDPENTVYDSRNNCNAIIKTSTNTLIVGCKTTVIPDDVTSIGDWAFCRNTELTSIEIPSSVTSIGHSSFNYCIGLKSITLPSSITSIDDMAFEGCDSLSAVYISDISAWCKVSFRDNPLSNAKHLFLNGEKVIELIIPEGVDSIKSRAFNGCEDLTSINISRSVTNIGSMAFGNNPKLTHISVSEENPIYDSRKNCNAIIETATNTLIMGCSNTIVPGGIINIGNRAFANCSGLTSLTLPYGVRNIGQYAFYSCSELTSISLPTTVNNIGEFAIGFSNKLDSLICKATTPPVLETDAFRACSNSIRFYVPEEALTLYQAADGWKSHTNFYTLPNMLASGKCGADADSANVVWELGEDSVLVISGAGAMMDFASLYPDGNNPTGDAPVPVTQRFHSTPRKAPMGLMTSTPWEAYILSIKTIHIERGVTHVGEYSFKGCSNLVRVNLPNNLQSIGNSAFSGCSRLEQIDCDAPTPAEISEYTFDSNTQSNCTLIVPIGSVPQYQSANYWRLFANINEAKCILASGTCGADGDNMTWEFTCDSVLTITGAGDMDNWSASNTPWYSNRNAIKHVSLPNELTSIGSYAFRSCTSLTDIVIPDNVTTISKYALSGCSKLTEITIGSSVNSIGNYAFQNCTSLATVYNYATTPLVISGTSPFSGASLSTCTLYVPEQSIELYQTASVWKDFGTILPINNPPSGCTIASGECGADGANVTWLLTCDSILTIGGDGRMADYNEETTIAPWYEYRDAYHSVYIAAGVLNVGDLAFRESPNLRYVDLASTVVSLGNYSFYNCPNLHSLTLPESVTTLSDNTPFGGTTTMTNPVLNSSVFVRLPENYAGEYTVAEGTTVIASQAFKGCNQLTSLVLPNTVHILSGSSVFENCTMLVSVNIPEGVTALGEFTFSNCSSLKAIDLPSTLASLGSYCFSECWMIESITCRATMPPEANGSSLSGVNYMIPIYVPAGTAEIYKAADGWSGFTDYRDIIDGCVIASGECGAEGNNLMWILYCDSVLTIRGTGAMENYSFNSDGQAPWAEHGLEIRDIVIEEGVRTIGAYAFYNAGSYTNGVYNNVRSVTIPNTVTKLQNNYFYQCPIQTVTLNSDSIVGQTTYSSNASLHKMFGAQVRQYIIGDSVKSIANSVFYNQSADSLKSILLPEGLTSIGSWAFGYLENLDSITLPRSLQSIGSDAFYGSGLRAVTIPGSVTDMGGQAFQNCDKLASVILEEGLTTLGTSAFQNCTALTEITIPESMVTISSGAFTDCTHLTKMTVLATAWVSADKSSSSTTKLAIGNYVRELILGDQIPTIGKYAFSSLDSLRTVTLPFNVTSLSNYAFSSCPSLACVISNALTPPTIQTNTFSRQDTLIVPCESKQLYKTAQYWQNFNRIRCADDQEMSISLTGNWTFIMVPSTFGMDAGDVTTEGDVQWATYNGSVRAMGRSGWENYSAEAVHMCSQALIVRATGETATLHINVPTNATAMVGTTVSLIPNAAALPQNANWCFTGNPYPYGYLLSGLAAQGITSPIAVWNGTGYDTYTPGIDDYIIPAFGAFFIQLPEGTVEPTVINFSAEYIYM